LSPPAVPQAKNGTGQGGLEGEGFGLTVLGRKGPEKKGGFRGRESRREKPEDIGKKRARPERSPSVREGTGTGSETQFQKEGKIMVNQEVSWTGEGILLVGISKRKNAAPERKGGGVWQKLTYLDIHGNLRTPPKFAGGKEKI